MLTEAGLLQDLVGAAPPPSAVRWDDVRLGYLWWRSKEKWLRSRVRVHFWWITPERHGEEGEPQHFPSPLHVDLISHRH